jgi:hypothetical protein
LGNGVTAETLPGPLDDAFLSDDLYDVTSGRSIIGYQVQADGSLTSLNLNVTVPAGSRGLVALTSGTQPVPEPSSLLVLATGLLFAAGVLGTDRVRRRRNGNRGMRVEIVEQRRSGGLTEQQ